MSGYPPHRHDREKDTKAEMLRYGHYQILVAETSLTLCPVALVELNAIGCPGLEFHTGLLSIARNAIDAATQLHNDNLSTTLPEEVHVSLKEYFAGVNNSSLHDEIVQHLLYPAFNMLVPGTGVELYGSQRVDQYIYALTAR